MFTESHLASQDSQTPLHADRFATAQPATRSAFGEDLKRYKRTGKLEWFEPSLWAIACYRFGQWCDRARPIFLRRLLRAAHLPFHSAITLITGIHLPRGAKVGGGLKIWHFGCIVLNPECVIGKNCTLRQGVTIGTRRTDHDVPVLGDEVDIGAGAKILGNIQIGNRVSIGANAVVLQDVPDDHAAVGVPARIVAKRISSTE
jgi:serine O-acetyltransferase